MAPSVARFGLASLRLLPSKDLHRKPPARPAETLTTSRRNAKINVLFVPHSVPGCTRSLLVHRPLICEPTGIECRRPPVSVLTRHDQVSLQAKAEAPLTYDSELDSEIPLNKTILEEEERAKTGRLDSWRKRWHRRWLNFKMGLKIFLILLFAVTFVWVFRKRMIFTVNSGEVLVIYYRFFGGTNHNSIGLEGLHILAPWDKGYIYVVRTQTLVVPMTVLTRNGVEVHLDAQARFHAVPETVPYLHRRYGQNYVKDIITPGLIESVQGVIGQFLPEEIYSSESGASSKQVFANARRVIGGVFVEVEDIALFNIRLPDRVQEAVQSKAAAEQGAEAAVFNQRRAELDAQAVQRYDDIVKTIPQSILVAKGIEATLELAKSPNTKIIVMGSKDSLPLVLGNVPDVVAK